MTIFTYSKVHFFNKLAKEKQNQNPYLLDKLQDRGKLFVDLKNIFMKDK